MKWELYLALWHRLRIIVSKWISDELDWGYTMFMRFFLLVLLVFTFIPTVSAAPGHHGLPPGTTGGDTGGKTPTGGCVEDRYEPDSQSNPQVLSPGELSDLGVCNGNDDYWAIDLRAGMSMTVWIGFSNAVADVDMTLHSADFTQIDVSESVQDFEELRYVATTNERLILRVYGYEGVSNMYDLRLDIEDFGPSCAGDSFESNDTMASASSVPTGLQDARICMGDDDWYVFDVEAGEGFDFGIEFDGEMSPLSIGLYAESSGLSPLEVRRPSGLTGQVAVDAAPANGRYFVRVFADDGGYNRYNFSVAVYEPGQLQSGTVAGAIQYEDELRGPDVVIGGASTRWLPVRDVPVELVRASDQRILATTYTDDRGSYRLPFTHRAGGEINVRVSPRLEGPGYSMQVTPHGEGERYESLSAPVMALNQNRLGEYTADFRFGTTERLGGAFNITDRSLDAFRFIAGHAQPTDLDLTIVWERGVPHSCTSCYSNNTISLGGGFDDPDEYDDSVILHEFGHFFIDVMSHDDSPGGNHGGERTDPLVAYGEGIATVFALMIEGHPIYVDTMQSGGMNQNFETANFPEARGTNTGNVHGQVSEYLVIAVIWDLFDAAPEPHDTISGGAESIMQVLLEYMPTAPSNNQGIAGAELADFVQGFRTLFPEDNEHLDRILTRHQFPAGIEGMAGPSGVK